MECPNQDLFNSIEKNERWRWWWRSQFHEIFRKKVCFCTYCFLSSQKKIILIFPGDLRFGRMDDITASKTTLPAKHSCQGNLRISSLNLSIDGISKSIHIEWQDIHYDVSLALAFIFMTVFTRNTIAIFSDWKIIMMHRWHWRVLRARLAALDTEIILKMFALRIWNRQSG